MGTTLTASMAAVLVVFPKITRVEGPEGHALSPLDSSLCAYGTDLTAITGEKIHMHAEFSTGEQLETEFTVDYKSDTYLNASWDDPSPFYPIWDDYTRLVFTFEVGENTVEYTIQ